MAFPASIRKLATSVHALIDESAQEWNVSRRAARVHFWLPIALSAIVGISRISRPVYHLLIMEDGIVEWATFFLAFLAGCAAAWITFSRWHTGYWAQAAIFGIFTLALVFLAGEEISWGQRVLGFETPESLNEINRKSEANLHNIGNFLSWTPFITFIAGVLGVSAWIANRRVRVERYIDDGGMFFVPPFLLSSSFLVVLLFSVAQFTILPLTGNTSTRFAEVSELCLAYGCCVFTWLIVPRMQKSTAGAALAGRAGQTAGDIGSATSIDPRQNPGGL